MMTLDEFKTTVLEKIKDYLPEGYENAIIETHKVSKVNRILEGLTIRKDASQSQSPTLYLENYYEMYKETGSLDETLTFMSENYEKAASVDEFTMPEDYKDWKDKIYMALVNTEQNKEMLADMPHREFQDLSVIYRAVVSKDDKGLVSMKVDNRLMKEMGLDADELFRIASVNTKELFPPKVENIVDILKGMIFASGMSDEQAKDILGDVPQLDMWVITNKDNMNGAASMLYDETLHKLAEKVGADLYIMPSSIHEVMAVSAEEGDLDFLSELVQEANMSSVDLCDRLSNNVYHYDKDLRKLTLATDVPNKRLDGLVVADESRNYEAAATHEAPLVYETGKSR